MPPSTRATSSSSTSNVQDSDADSSLTYSVTSSAVPILNLDSQPQQSPPHSEVTYPEWLLADLKEPSTLFLGNPKLLTHLTEWYNEGRTRCLILKRQSKTDAA